MALDYSSYSAFMASLLVYDPADAEFVLLLPRMIEAAEDRMYRDFDFLYTVKAAEVALVAGTRTATIPGDIQIVQSANLITPASTAANAGTRNPLQRVTPEFINYAWPTVTDTGVPVQYAMYDQTTAIVGPAPDAAYKVEFWGTYQPDPLSAINPSTFITENLPDIFIAASAVFGFGYQRDFGQASDNPQAAVSWEAQYQGLSQSVQVTEARKKAQSQGWQAYSPTPAVAPSQPRS